VNTNLTEQISRFPGHSKRDFKKNPGHVCIAIIFIAIIIIAIAIAIIIIIIALACYVMYEYINIEQ